MKYLYLLALAFNCTALYSMEPFFAKVTSLFNSQTSMPAQTESDYEKAQKFVYQKDGMFAKYNQASFELLEAIAAKNTARIDTIIHNFPEQGRAYLINAPIDLINSSKEISYPALSALKDKLPFRITPLALAIYIGQPKSVELLHAHNVRMDFMCDRVHVLEYAVQHNPALIPLLVACGASLDENDNGAIFAAAHLDKADAAGHLIAAGVNVNAHETYNGSGCTPLHVACVEGNFDVAKVLLENGAHVDATDTRGYTPLQRCVMSPKCRFADLLLHYGADITREDHRGRSIIELLTYNFQATMAFDFIQNGAPYPRSKEHQTLVDHGLESVLSFNCPAYKKFVTALIKSDTAIALAAINEASGNQLNDVTYSPEKYSFIHWATVRNNLPVLTELLNRRTSQSSTLRAIALEIPLISRIIQHPVNVDAQDINGLTSLMWAARLGLKPIYNALKQAGANDMLKNKEGKTASLIGLQGEQRRALAARSKPSLSAAGIIQEK